MDGARAGPRPPAPWCRDLGRLPRFRQFFRLEIRTIGANAGTTERHARHPDQTRPSSGSRAAGTMLGSCRALAAIALTIGLLLTGPAAAGAIPQTERPSVAPILQKATPGVVNIATK